MIIISHHTNNPKIRIIEILSELTGNAAIRFQNYSYSCLNDKRYHLLIDFKHVRKIDSLGMKVLEYFIDRGMNIRLFNVDSEVVWMLKLSGKSDIIKTYGVADYDTIVSQFEREIESIDNGLIKTRHHPRIDTFFKIDFRYHPHENGPVSSRATVLNISEGGFFADQILVMNAVTEEIIIPSEIEGHKLYDMEFKLAGDSLPIKTNGECMREIRTQEKLSAGICFRDMKQDHMKMIKDYICNNPSKDEQKTALNLVHP